MLIVLVDTFMINGGITLLNLIPYVSDTPWPRKRAQVKHVFRRAHGFHATYVSGSLHAHAARASNLSSTRWFVENCVRARNVLDFVNGSYDT